MDMRTLYLKRQEERRIRAGHLWIFSNEVDIHKSPLTQFASGEMALIADHRGAMLGSAYVNPHSLICARLVSHKANVTLDAALLRKRLEHALHLRERLWKEPFYRLCHGEGDFLPGLVIDRYGEHLSLQITTAGMDVHTSEIVDVLTDLVHPSSILLRNTTPSRTLENLPLEQRTALGNPPETLIVPENGVHFQIPYLQGQKTGWFFDQCNNRKEAARYATEQHVLDIFSYVGGFGLTAAQQGAASVTFMDASAPALDYAMQSAANMASCPASTIQGDALQELGRLKEEERRFGLVCLDPPAFIKRRKDAALGLKAYAKANALALDLLEDGGILVTCSCSHHLELQALHRCIAQAAAKRRLHGEILYTGTQGADHPVHYAMPETAYLKCLIARFHKE